MTPSPDPGPCQPPPIELERRYGARNYDPLPVMLQRGEGVWLFDTDGRRYLDMMSAYSAVSFGHAHPALVRALTEQAAALAVTSRAFHTARLGAFLERLCTPDRHGPGAADEHRRRSGRDGDQGRAQVGLQGQARAGGAGGDHRRRRQLRRPHDDHRRLFQRSPVPRRLRPVHARLRQVPFGDAAALEAAITPNTAAFIVEPMQGEAGIIVPPAGYLARGARDLHPPQRADDRRRGADRPRPHRPPARLRPRGRPARRADARQGARRRPAAGQRLPGPRRRDGAVRARRPRQHLRRQPARRGGRRPRRWICWPRARSAPTRRCRAAT